MWCCLRAALRLEDQENSLTYGQEVSVPCYMVSFNLSERQRNINRQLLIHSSATCNRQGWPGVLCRSLMLVAGPKVPAPSLSAVYQGTRYQ